MIRGRHKYKWIPKNWMQTNDTFYRYAHMGMDLLIFVSEEGDGEEKTDSDRISCGVWMYCLPHINTIHWAVAHCIELLTEIEANSLNYNITYKMVSINSINGQYSHERREREREKLNEKRLHQQNFNSCWVVLSWLYAYGQTKTGNKRKKNHRTVWINLQKLAEGIPSIFLSFIQLHWRWSDIEHFDWPFNWYAIADGDGRQTFQLPFVSNWMHTAHLEPWNWNKYIEIYFVRCICICNYCCMLIKAKSENSHDRRTSQ